MSNQNVINANAMNISDIQQQLFQFIKTRLPAEASVADEVAKLLNISSDSAYRRMRGEKQITFEELYLLCTNYRISLDQLMNIQTGGFAFQGSIVNTSTFGFDQYLTGMMHTMAYFNSFKSKELYHSCKDMPIFHHFHLREVAAFKWFFWHKTYLQSAGFAKKKFKFSEYPDEVFNLAQQVLGLFNQLSTREIWNIESMSIFLRQIEFYRDSQLFESDEDALKLYEALEKTWDHLERQAALGYKFRYDDPERKPLGEYKMYFNEVLLGDNSFLAVTDGVKMAVLTHTTFNYIMTRDVTFTENMYTHMLNQMKRSTLISEVSEKERSRFFRIIRDRIHKRKEALSV
ncbi:MAG TPA: hypothetical protein VJ765_16190 [Chitinophagaceae bacterium]|nr:hypothetical protein [Chitinophagaceae bacterium]